SWQRYLQKSARPGRSDPTPVSYRLPDGFKNRLDVLMNGSILESEKFDTQSLQKRGAFGLVLCSKLPEVRRTVQFNAYVALHAEKVDNVATYAVLPAEFLAEDLPALKVLP